MKVRSIICSGKEPSSRIECEYCTQPSSLTSRFTHGTSLSLTMLILYRCTYACIIEQNITYVKNYRLTKIHYTVMCMKVSAYLLKGMCWLITFVEALNDIMYTLGSSDWSMMSFVTLFISLTFKTNSSLMYPYVLCEHANWKRISSEII